MSCAPRPPLLFLTLVILGAGCGPRPRPPHLTPPDATTAAARRAYDAAVATFEAGDLAAAEDAFRALRGDAHTGPLARLYLGRIALARGEAEVAADQLDALAADGDAPVTVRNEARFHAALAAAAADRCGEAEPPLRAATEAPDGPRRADAHLALARCAADDAAAVAHLAAAVEAAPSRQVDVEARLAARLEASSAAELEALALAHDGGPLRLPLWRATARASRLGGDDARLRRALEALPSDDPEAERGRAALSPTRLGVLLPLSGRSAPIGTQLQAALDVLAGRRGEDHPDGPAGPSLVVRDAGTAPAAVAALKAMKAQEVAAAVGVFDHTVAAAAAAAARAEGLPLVMLTLADAAVEGDAGTWRALHTPKLVGRTAAAVLADRGATRAVVLRPESPYGEAHGAWFRAAWRGAGRRALDEVTWAPGKADWGRIAKRVAGLAPDAIFLPAAPGEVTQVVRHLAAAGVWVRGKSKRFAREKGVQEVWLVGTPEWYEPRLPEAGARYLEGALVPVPWAAELRQGAPLARRVQAEAGRRATAFDAVLSDALHAATVAHRAGRGLEAVRYADGATPGLDFGQRDALTALFVVEVSGGGFRPAE